MWLDKRVSVVLMTYAEKDSIRSVIEGFFDTGLVDEVVVINNNAQEGTWEEVEATRAIQVSEERQGYGWATRRGLQESTGDIVVLCEPDGTFAPEDIKKLLSYSPDVDAVFGSRTHFSLLWHGANMGFLLRWGNRVVAKLVQVLFGTNHLSDVGCSYRLLSRDLIDRLIPQLRIGGSQLGPELMIRTIASGAHFVEIPVNYLPRVGRSSVTGDLSKALVLGLQMVVLILGLRLETMGRARRLSRRMHGTRPTDASSIHRTDAGSPSPGSGDTSTASPAGLIAADLS